MTIPIFNLTRQYSTIKKEVNQAIHAVLSRGNFILGPEVTAFEKEFARYIGAPYAIGVASGTDALTLALRALKLGKEDEVLVPVNSYPTFFGVYQAGVTVRFADCNEAGNLSVSDLKKRITEKTKVIIVVHLYGNPADISGIKKLLLMLQRSDIAIIEDCAQAHGATIGKKRVGTFGVISCFSFYPSKNLGAYGDGGMVVTSNKRMADHIRALRMYGEVKRYESKEPSGVSRLDELHAAVLRIKLRHLNTWNTRRRHIAMMYTKGLKKVHGLSIIPYEQGACYHLFVIRTNRRDDLKTYLEQCGVGCAIHYPKPLAPNFPMAERASTEFLSIPMYPELTSSEIKRVIFSIKKFF